MNLPKSIGLLLFALLGFIPKIILTSPPNQRTIRLNKSANQTSTNKSPHWEYILREFVFKTISSPPQTSIILYKKLLEAPFYGGPLPTLSNEDNVLLSRGNVYHLSDGQWILCQDNCNKCIPCSNQKNPIVKWTLRRVKRFISADSYRYDLQLTVFPQLKEGVLKNFQTGNYVYVPYESIASSDAIFTTEMSHIDRSRSSRSWRRMQRDEHGQVDQYNALDKKLNSTTEYSNLFSPSNHQHNVTNSESFVPTHRLIMGIDQSGKKYIIHVVSVGPSEISDNNYSNNNNDNNNNNSVDYESNRNPHRPSYQQYINKLLESIHSHRPIIEGFLSYNRVKIDNSNSSFYPVYSEFIDNNTKFHLNFETRNENNRPRNWSQILTRMPRDKNYIPKLIKKFNSNFTNIIRSRSINLF